MKSVLQLSLLFILFMTLSAEKCSKKAIDPLLGTWDYRVTDTPQGDYEGQLVLSNEDGQYTGKLISNGVESVLENLKIEGNTASFTTNAAGFDVGVNGTFEGNKFGGSLSAEGYEFPFTATKRADKE